MGTDANPYGLGLFVHDWPDARVTIPATTVDALEKAGLSQELVAKLRTLAGREFKGGIKFGQAMKQQFSATELEAISAVAGREMIPVYRNLNGRVIVGHEGEIGEYVVAMPAYHIAVARTIDEKRGRAGDFQFHSLVQLVYNLAPRGWTTAVECAEAARVGGGWGREVGRGGVERSACKVCILSSAKAKG